MMRRIFATRALLSAVLIAGFVGNVFGSGMVSVGTDNVNMRDGPGKRSSVIWRLGRDYPLQVVQRNGSWLKVRDFEGDVGWVHSRLTNLTPHRVVKSRTANLRSGPGTGYRVIERLKYGDVLRTMEKRAGWVHVALPDKARSGWVARFLTWGW